MVRQIAFYSFERRVSTQRRGRRDDAERLGEIWLEVQSESLGRRSSCTYETFWTYIPHFIHSPSNVTAMPSATAWWNSLYAVYEEAAAGFQEKYFGRCSRPAAPCRATRNCWRPSASTPSHPASGRGSGVERLITELEAMESEPRRS